MNDGPDQYKAISDQLRLIGKGLRYEKTTQGQAESAGSHLLSLAEQVAKLEKLQLVLDEAGIRHWHGIWCAEFYVSDGSVWLPLKQWKAQRRRMAQVRGKMLDAFASDNREVVVHVKSEKESS